MTKNRRSSQAVSEVVGVILLLGITIGLFGFLNYVVFSFSFQPSAPSVNLVGSIDIKNCIITIEHNGGESLDGNINVIITINNNNPDPKSISYLINETTDPKWNFNKINTDYKWNLGETVQYYYKSSDTNIRVTVIDTSTNTIILSTIFL
jgi:FlaG/FlaF family flagellin (archaellin)